MKFKHLKYIMISSYMLCFILIAVETSVWLAFLYSCQVLFINAICVLDLTTKYFKVE